MKQARNRLSSQTPGGAGHDPQPPESKTGNRPIRSFVRREGRLTRAQARALEELWPRYGVDHPGPALEPASLFGRDAPLNLEIGFGNGDGLIRAATAHPERNFIGIEVHRPGVGALLLRLAREDVANVRLINADAVEVLSGRIPCACLDAVWIYFPDPWPKKRHHKRRLVQPAFARLLSTRLKPGGILCLATDWAGYAEQMLAVLDHADGLENIAGRGQFTDRHDGRPETRFEKRGVMRGHKVYDLSYRKLLL